jgi:hypothetical protein
MALLCGWHPSHWRSLRSRCAKKLTVEAAICCVKMRLAVSRTCRGGERLLSATAEMPQHGERYQVTRSALAGSPSTATAPASPLLLGTAAAPACRYARAAGRVRAHRRESRRATHSAAHHRRRAAAGQQSAQTLIAGQELLRLRVRSHPARVRCHAATPTSGRACSPSPPPSGATTPNTLGALI